MRKTTTLRDAGPATGLERTLAVENVAEDSEVLSVHRRTTCRLHGRWAHQCVSSPVHAIAVTGHRWCRGCGVAANVAVDELAATVTVTCPRCGGFPDSGANRELIRACETSIRRARNIPGLRAA